MSDEQIQSPEPVVDVDGGASIPGEAPQIDDVESRARAQGWVPKDEFRGPADRWRDAADFVKRGDEELPILRERNRTLERRMAALERDSGERYARLERLTATTLQRQRQEIASRYETAMRDAVQTGDLQRYDQLQRDQYEAVSDFDKRTQEQAPQKQGHALPDHEAASVESWKAKNGWFEQDLQLNAAAQAIHVGLRREKPGMSLDENLAEVTRQVRLMFPAKFGTARSTDPAIVEGSGGRMATGKPSSGVSRLSAEERKIGERFVKEGLFKNLDEYARELQTA